MSDFQKKTIAPKKGVQYVEHPMSERMAMSILAQFAIQGGGAITAPMSEHLKLGNLGPCRLRLYLPVQTTNEGLATDDGPLNFKPVTDDKIVLLFERVPVPQAADLDLDPDTEPRIIKPAGVN